MGALRWTPSNADDVAFPEIIQQLRARCLLSAVRFDTLHELKNGSEDVWEGHSAETAIFFGFGGLNGTQLQKVLMVIEQELPFLT